jgi:tetratricopeptide (TPR) repeat protein
MSNLGVVNFYLGRFRQADERLTAAHALQVSIGDRYGQTISLCTRAYLLSEQGHTHEALEVATEALDLARDTGDHPSEAYALITFGHIRRALGAPRQALKYYRQGRDLAAGAQDWLPAVEAMIGEAQARLDVGDVGGGTAMAQEALQRATELSFHLLGAQALTVLAAAHLADSRHDDAHGYATRALGRHKEMGHLPGEARTHLVMAEIYHASGDMSSSAASLDTARTQFADIGLAPWTEPEHLRDRIYGSSRQGSL